MSLPATSAPGPSVLESKLSWSAGNNNRTDLRGDLSGYDRSRPLPFTANQCSSPPSHTPFFSPCGGWRSACALLFVTLQLANTSLGSSCSFCSFRSCHGHSHNTMIQGPPSQCAHKQAKLVDCDTVKVQGCLIFSGDFTSYLYVYISYFQETGMLHITKNTFFFLYILRDLKDFSFFL